MLEAARTRSPARGAYEEYHPYGSTAWWAGTSGLVSQKRYRFTGMERDEETGLQCHGVRYYAVWLGRWVSADPIGLGDGVNRYQYCAVGPSVRMDRDGTASVKAEPTLELPGTKSEVIADARARDAGDPEKGRADYELYVGKAAPGTSAFTRRFARSDREAPVPAPGGGTDMEDVTLPTLISSVLPQLRAKTSEDPASRETGALYFTTSDGREGVLYLGYGYHNAFSESNPDDMGTYQGTMGQAMLEGERFLRAKFGDSLSFIAQIHTHPTLRDSSAIPSGLNGDIGALVGSGASVSIVTSDLAGPDWQAGTVMMAVHGEAARTEASFALQTSNFQPNVRRGPVDGPDGEYASPAEGVQRRADAGYDWGIAYYHGAGSSRLSWVKPTWMRP